MGPASNMFLGKRFLNLVIAAGLLIGFVWFFVLPPLDIAKRLGVPGLSQRPHEYAPIHEHPTRPHHPIDDLVKQAEESFSTLVAKKAGSLQDAARAYRERRGRQPPPGFNIWYDYASKHSAIVVEDFFDPIYHDLSPFWGVTAKQMREQANGFRFRVSVRNGNVSKKTDEVDRPWMDIWSDMVASVAEHLPDVDLPINIMDESRMIVPWEEIQGYLEKEHESRTIALTEKVKTDFQDLSFLDENPPEPFDPQFDRNYPYWPKVVVGCSPDSPARKKDAVETDYSQPPPLTGQRPERSYHGYVQNWTFATSPCDNAGLQGLHGTFVEPISLSNTQRFFPLFGGSKLPVNNEILLPPAMYWTEDPFYSGGNDHGSAWPDKKDMMVWRGVASGGRNTIDNWTRFQRHRFVAMMNATNIRVVETGSEGAAPNFVLPADNAYTLAAEGSDFQPAQLGDWVDSWSDAAMVNLECTPRDDQNPKECRYTNPYFAVAESIPMKKQFAAKYLPDIDGNSFSGRYRGFLRSTSMPIKATIYREWHDSRLIPWKHFAPMDNTFIDIYGIMEYFLGNSEMNVEGHDEVAERIASSGKEWAEKVLRKEDMSVYVFRLLLEYARLCDDDRENMAWVERDVL